MKIVVLAFIGISIILLAIYAITGFDSPEIAYVKSKTEALSTPEERIDHAKSTMLLAISEKCGKAPSEATMKNQTATLAINHMATEEFLKEDMRRYARNTADRIACEN